MNFEFYFIFILCVYLLLLNILRLNKSYYSIKEIDVKLILLQQNYKLIKEELINAETKWIEWPEKYLYQNNSWKIIPIFAFNKWIPRYANFFPKTISLLRNIKNIKTILFSRLSSNNLIKPHQGWSILSNKILRCHLPLACRGENYLVVNGKKKTHHLGKLIIFDDSKLHYSVNRSRIERIVLIIDIIRPDWIKSGRSSVKTTPELVNIVRKVID